MDLKLYFHKVHTIEATIPGEHAVVVSLETPDGGKAGQMSEVSRTSAAKLVVQGKVRLADEKETKEFKSETRAAKKAVEELAMKDRVQLNVLQDSDVELIRNALRKDQ